MALKICTSVTKVLQLKGRNFVRLSPTFVEVTGEKLVGDFLVPLKPPLSPILNRVKLCTF